MRNFFFFLLLTLFPAAAQAYIGPGAALGLAGYFFGVIGAAGAAVAMVVAYPVYRLFKRRRTRQRPDANPPQ